MQIPQSVKNSFNVVNLAASIYVTHENFSTRVAHLIAAWVDLLAILVLLDMIPITEVQIAGSSIQISLGMIVLAILILYYISLEWFCGILTSLALILPLWGIKSLEAMDVSLWAIAITAIILFFVIGYIEVLFHKYIDNERSVRLPNIPIREKIFKIVRGFFIHPFFFLLFLLVGLGYKPQTLGKEIRTQYKTIIAEGKCVYKPVTLDKNGNPKSKNFLNKPHFTDLS